MYDWLKNVTPRYHAYHGVLISDIGAYDKSHPQPRYHSSFTHPVRDCFQLCYHVKAGSQIALPSSYCISRFYCISGQSSVGDLLFFFLFSFLIRLL